MANANVTLNLELSEQGKALLQEIKDAAEKAGARHSAGDRAAIKRIHDGASAIVADALELGHELEEATAKGNPLKAVSETDTELRVANYIVLFGGRDLEGTANANKNDDGSRGEFFTPATDLESEATKSNAVMVDWEHATGRGKVTDGIAPGEFLGRVDWKTARPDERGVWVERVLNRRLKYVQWLAELIKAGLVGNSSEADPTRVVKGANGEIKRWPILRDTLTVSPMEPRMLTANAVAALKALGYLDTEATPQTDTTGADSPVAVAPAQPVVQPASKATEITEMTQEEMIALLDKRDAEKAAAAKVEADRAAAEAERTAAAVKAAEEKIEAKLKAQYAAAGRLPIGEAPAQSHFAETNKYDGLKAEDQAFMVALLAGKHGGQKGRVSDAAIKALAIKVAEEKTEQGELGRRELMAKGIDPAAMLSAKANEVNYSTLANFGDEWVGVEYSRRLWPSVRAERFILSKLRTIEVPQGTESVIIPLESGDPTFYKVAQTTDENATTLTPNATVPSSKLGTARNTLTVAKGGARVQFSGEMEEDSLIPWAPQLREQMETASGEQLEHVLIDGDTETGGTANINDIGGTPAGNEFFLLFNGFRKSPLVTTTANATSLAAPLSDTHFITVKNLMGVAGKNAADLSKVFFVMDPNTYDKALQLASVKTQDVFSQATIENGVLTRVWGYEVRRSYFMHYMATSLKANTAGKVDQDTQNNNTTGALLAVRPDQWVFGYKRRITFETVRIPRADVTEITALMRVGLLQRDTEGAAIGYNITLA